MQTRLNVIKSALAERDLPDSLKLEVYKQIPGLIGKICDGFENVIDTKKLRQPLDEAAADDFRASINGILDGIVLDQTA